MTSHATALLNAASMSQMSGVFFLRKSFCVVTGASRGLGKEIAIQLSKEWDREGT